MNNIIRKKFDKGNPNWDENPEFSKLYLNAQRNYFNDVMQIQGFVFLRDVYMGLGLATTKESCMLGWVKGVVAGADFVKFDFTQIEGTNDFELVFECYPILDYMEMENVAG